MNNTPAHLVEIFSSIQGEGIHVGLRQAFLRFHGCSLSCGYCDSRNTLVAAPPDACRIEKRPGTGECVLIKNPVSLEQVRAVLEEWLTASPNSHHSISITGGEPLLHAAVLKDWLPTLRRLLPIYLETNGIMHAELSECIDDLDYISMDVKLPSTSGMQDLWEEHRIFMQKASQRKLFVKAVVGPATPAHEVIKTCEIIHSVDWAIPLVLQPLTTARGEVSVSGRTLLEFQELASGYLKEVRVIPQTHRFLNLL
jgi:organic radical activating enzyme